MSRGQSTQAFNTASNENATDFGNAQSAFGSTEDAIGNYNNQLAKFVSGNPYTPGGEYDQTINTGLANVSDAGANSLAGALQAQARRTGQNSAADAATAAAGAQQNTRDLSGDLAARTTKAHCRRSRLQPGCPGRIGGAHQRQPVALWDIFERSGQRSGR